MSYTLTPQIKKTRSFSKYLCSNADSEDDFYIFDIKFISNKKKSKKIKKIKNTKCDQLINISDGITYNKYRSLVMNIININNPLNNHSFKVDLTSNSVIYHDNFIYLEITSELGLLKCFYNLDVNKV